MPDKLRRFVWPTAVLALAFFLRVHLLPTVPFGWHPDEATKALLARDVLAGKYFPVFFSAFTGREALYVYLEAAAFGLVGESMFTGRLLSAFIGLLTVAMTYAIGRELINRRVGLLAAALFSVSLWHLIASRNGYRALIQSLVQLPVLWFLFRGWRAKELSERAAFGWREQQYYIAAGLFLGLTQYTYTAARFFPIFAGSIILLAGIFAPSLVKQRLTSLALMIAVSMIAVVPLAVHFLNHPIDFWGRVAQISTVSAATSGGDVWPGLRNSLGLTAGMFTRWGDPNYRFNLGGAPVFGLLEGALFYLGLPLALWLAVRTRGRQRVIYLSLFAWVGIMILPMTLTEFPPYYQRAIGILPGLYFFPALTLDIAATRANQLLAQGRRWTLICAGLVALVGGLAVQVYAQYFDDWHMAERNDDDRRVAMVYVADYLKQAELSGELYLSTEYMQHPTLALLAPGQYEGIHWFDARQSLPLPAGGSPATYLLLAENRPQPLLLAKTPQLQHIHTGLDRFNRTVFDVYRWHESDTVEPSDQSQAVWSWEVTFEPEDPAELRHTIDLPVNFGGVMEFLGHDRSSVSLLPGQTLELILYWRLRQRPERHYAIFVHLLDARGNVVGGYDANTYPTSYWQEGGGERLLSYFPVQLNPAAPPGPYQLEIGVYNQPTGQRLPIYDNSEIVADRLLLSPISGP